MALVYAFNKRSIDGRRIAACIDMGLPIELATSFREQSTLVDSQQLPASVSHYITLNLVCFSTPQRKSLAVFDRCATNDKGEPRTTSGLGIFCGLDVSLSDAKSTETQMVESLFDVPVNHIAYRGYGVSQRGHHTYISSVYEVTLDEESRITLPNARDKFIGFASTDEILDRLGPGRDVERELLASMAESTFDESVFRPVSMQCSIEQLTILGVDIEKFSMFSNEAQTMKYITLQVLLQEIFDGLNVAAATIQTGDGCFVVFKGLASWEALTTCIALQRRLTELPTNDLGQIRMRYALHWGYAFQVVDLNGQPNFIGNAMNYTARLLAIKDANVVAASTEFFDTAQASIKRSGIRFTQGSLAVKHMNGEQVAYFSRFL